MMIAPARIFKKTIVTDYAHIFAHCSFSISFSSFSVNVDNLSFDPHATVILIECKSDQIICLRTHYNTEIIRFSIDMTEVITIEQQKFCDRELFLSLKPPADRYRTGHPKSRMRRGVSGFHRTIVILFIFNVISFSRFAPCVDIIKIRLWHAHCHSPCRMRTFLSIASGIVPSHSG